VLVIRLQLVSMFVLCGVAAAEQPKVPPEFDNALPDTAAEVLAAAEAIELLSLDPQAAGTGSGPFGKYKVLGSTTVANRAARAKLVEAITAGIPKSASPLQAGACFEPRHGLRAKAKGTVVELVICYECWRVNVYLDGRFKRLCVTERQPRGHLNDLLTVAKVPLAPQPKSKE
jgi:hypothetical protein